MARDLERPLYKDQRPWFEIWFAVVIDADRKRAAWVRQTLFVPKHGDARATVWAAWFDGGDVRANKRLMPVSAVRAGEGDVLVHHDDCRIARDGAAGTVGDFRWELAWTGGSRPADPLPAWVPAPTHSHALVHDADATGTVTLAGQSVDLRGRALAIHVWGRRRMPTLHWIWAPWLGDASLEMTAVSLRDRLSLGLATLRLDGDDPKTRVSGRPTSTAHPDGLVTATMSTPRRLVHVRAWAEPEAMVGYAYRDTDGRDLMVAQSDSGSAHLEIWTRTAPGVPWRLADERRSAGGVAVEIHQREALPDVAYLAWDATDRPIPPRPPVAPADDEVAWPDLGAIVALGLTYRDHVKETGSKIEATPVAFGKRGAIYGPADVVVPDTAELRAAADEVEPGLGAALVERIPCAPAVMDYEGELALVALGPIDVAALARGTPQPFGLAAANDLTARVIQVLGEGQPNVYDYWARAKSFPRFLPLAPRVWAPAGGIATIPELDIETRVNGERRQRGSTTELLYDLVAIARAGEAFLKRPLARGDVILTGTPAGIGMRLGPIKREIAKRITDRFRKAELLVAGFATSATLLRPGDVIEVSAGRAGRVRARLVV